MGQPYRGSVQAQGSDIGVAGGYTSSWAQYVALTADEGNIRLDALESQCSRQQLHQRTRAFKKARRFIENARAQGGVGPESQPHSFQDPKRTISDARVDIEINAGLTFVP